MTFISLFFIFLVDPANIDKIIDRLTTGQVTHDYPISVEEATAMGLPVTGGLPLEIYSLMDLYPQPMMGRPTVQHIPMPYQSPPVLPNSPQSP